jgi:hypothetical protein
MRAPPINQGAAPKTETLAQGPANLQYYDVAAIASYPTLKVRDPCAAQASRQPHARDFFVAHVCRRACMEVCLSCLNTTGVRALCEECAWVWQRCAIFATGASLGSCLHYIGMCVNLHTRLCLHHGLRSSTPSSQTCACARAAYACERV